MMRRQNDQNYRKETAIVKMQKLSSKVNYYILKTICELKG